MVPERFPNRDVLSHILILLSTLAVEERASIARERGLQIYSVFCDDDENSGDSGHLDYALFNRKHWASHDSKLF
jgi:hypothetical protein